MSSDAQTTPPVEASTPSPAVNESKETTVPGKYVVSQLSLVCFGIVAALAALTASLPLNLPMEQYAQSAAYLDTSAVNSGDTAWMIVATILGLALTPALAGLYGSAHASGSYSTINLAMLTAALIGFFWIVFGFSLVYGKDSGLHDHRGYGIMGYPATFYMFRNVGPAPSVSLAPTIPLSIFAIYELAFPFLALTIISNYFRSRLTTSGWLCFALAWFFLVYCPIAHMFWTPDGLVARTGVIQDFSGGVVVHLIAGVTAFAGEVYFYPRKQIEAKTHEQSNLFSFGSYLALTWLCWFAFNAGKAHNAGFVATQSIVNTLGGSCAGVLSWVLLDWVRGFEPNEYSLGNALLLALIALSPASGYVSVGGAMCISILTTLTAYMVALSHSDLPCTQAPKHMMSVMTLHGVGGACGFFWTAFFSYEFINPASYNGVMWGRGVPLGHHIALLIVIIPVVYSVSWCLFLILDKTVGLTPESEAHRREIPSLSQCMKMPEVLAASA